MSGLLGAFTERGTQFDSGLAPLSGARHIAAVRRGNDTIVYVPSQNDDAITAFRLTSTGQLEPFATGFLTGVDETADATSLLVVEAGGAEYLIVAKNLASGVASLRIEASGALTPVDNVPDSPTLQISFVQGVMSSLVIAGETYVFVPGRGESGVSVFRVEANGMLTNVDNENDADDGLNALDGVY